MPSRFHGGLVAALFLAACALSLAADRPLVHLAEADWEAQKAAVTADTIAGAAALVLRSESTAGYPGVSVSAPDGAWDLSAHGGVAATVTNRGAAELELALRVDNAGDWRQQPWSVSQAKLKPGETATLTTVFGRAWDAPKAGFDPARIVKVFLYVARGQGPVDLALTDLRAVGAPAAADTTAAFVQPDGPRALVDPTAADFDLDTALRPQDAQYSLADTDAGRVIDLQLGTESSWPGVTFYPPDGAWDLRGFAGVEADITNLSDHPYRVSMRLDNHNATGNRNSHTEVILIEPGATRTLTVTFGRSWGKPSPSIDPQKVIAALIFGDKNRAPTPIRIHALRAVTTVANPVAAVPQKPKPQVVRVRTDYPADLSFEPPEALHDLNGGVISTDAAEVIAGAHSLLGDSRGQDRTWFEFATTRPGLFVPGFRYDVTFRYRVIAAAEGARFYALFRSHSQGWGRWDRGWTDQRPIVAEPGAVREGRISAGLTNLDDYQLMFGIHGEARIAIDSIHIEQVEPYSAPDPEHEKVKAIPEAAETLVRVDFEDGPGALSLRQPDRVGADSGVISGAASLRLDSLGAGGEWNGQGSIKPELLEGGYRYHVHLRSRALKWEGHDTYAYLVAKRVGGKEEPKDIVWKRWHGQVGADAWVYTAFDLPAGQRANLELGLHRQAQVLVDDLVIRREVLPAKAIAIRVPFARSDANLVWRDEFDGEALDASRWHRYHQPRRGGWWHRDDAYLDGEGHLVLRFREHGDSFAMGAIHTDGIFNFTYGYVEARMKLPTQTGHWPGIWLMGGKVNNVGEAGRDGTEIDIVEAPWRTKDLASHALHWDGYGLDHQSTGYHVEVPGLHEGWHTFAVDWSPAGYIFYIDGRETWRTDAGEVCRNPLHIILSEEMGGWSGNPRAAKDLPDHTRIDYIRVWQEKPTAAAAD